MPVAVGGAGLQSCDQSWGETRLREELFWFSVGAPDFSRVIKLVRGSHRSAEGCFYAACMANACRRLSLFLLLHLLCLHGKCLVFTFVPRLRFFAPLFSHSYESTLSNPFISSFIQKHRGRGRGWRCVGRRLHGKCLRRWLRVRLRQRGRFYSTRYPRPHGRGYLNSAAPRLLSPAFCVLRGKGFGIALAFPKFAFLCVLCPLR